MPSRNGVTLPDPRCPFCHVIMQEVQLKWEEAPFDPTKLIPHEVWNCDSCHTNHVFPARIDFLRYVGASHILPFLRRIVHNPVLN